MAVPDKPRSQLTIRDLAAKLGVSKTTVSNAFSRPDQLSAVLRDRVLEAAREAGYAGPDAMARMLRTRRAGAIGVILPESLPFALDDPVAGELFKGIADACEERRLGLLVVPGGVHAADASTVRELAVDGFIAYSLPRDSRRLEAALARNVPTVVVDDPRLPGVTTVAIDNAGGARGLARHLLELGHRRFGIIAMRFQTDGYTGPGTRDRVAASMYESVADRFTGYAEALSAARIDTAAVPFYECAHSDEAHGVQATQYLLGLDEHPTAILAMTDRLAIGAIKAARAAGLRVPADLSVVGFDDIASAAHARPALTTVHQELRLKGYAAARLLLDGDASGSRLDRAASVAAASDELNLPIELVIRRSTGPARRA
jgi:DNA-binding LacI/PurR family transcriptional regulator